MLAPSLSTRGTLLKFQALQMLSCLSCSYLAFTVSVNKMTPHSTDRVLLYACALDTKHIGHNFEVSSITNFVCFIWSLEI